MKKQLSKEADQRRRFAVTSAASAVLETTVFLLLVRTVFSRRKPLYLFGAVAVSRLLSSMPNYLLCSDYVFDGGSRRRAARYYLLCAVMLLCSGCFTGFLAGTAGLPVLPVKLAGDALLGVGSYRVLSLAVFNPSDSENRFFGPFARRAQTVMRLFSRRYECRVQPDGEPVVYVCRHLNMHGPYTTLKWLTFDVHPLILSAFFDPREGYEHMRTYTFSGRWGHKPMRFSLLSWLGSRGAYLAASSTQAVPTYRRSSSAITTLRTGLRYLKKGESLIVFPDVDYTGCYGTESEIYEGFLYYGEMYRKSTGRPLRFVPIYIDDSARTVTAGQPVTVGSRSEVDCAARQLKAAINGHQAA